MEQETVLNVSVVVPAFNEERRLPPTLIDMIDFFDHEGRTYEILVVDDGSTDSTPLTVKKFQRIKSEVRLIQLPKNKGKGNAVRTGMLKASGELCLFADADGATPIEEFKRLEKAIQRGADVAIGSRAKNSEETKVETRIHRKVIGRTFNFLVNTFLIPDVKDTQCGFKLFTKDAAHFLFSRQRSEQFSFDIELLFLANRVEMKVEEVPINWTNIPGSKVNLVLDAAKMFRDIFVFRIRHRKVKPSDFDRSEDDQTRDENQP